MEANEKEPGFFKRYRSAIFISLLNALTTGFLTGLWTSTYMLSKLKSGDDPEMPKELIEQQYHDAFPSVMMFSILLGLAAGFLFLILNLYLQFKYRHNVNIFKELKREYSKKS